jgi:hypothetical protein
VNPITGARESWADVPTKKTEQPQHEQNDDDGPHGISPLNVLVKATRSSDRMAVDLTVEQDKDASCNGEDRQDQAQSAQTQKLDKSPGDKKDGQQDHADISSDVHGVAPFVT